MEATVPTTTEQSSSALGRTAALLSCMMPHMDPEPAFFSIFVNQPHPFHLCVGCYAAFEIVDEQDQTLDSIQLWKFLAEASIKHPAMRQQVLLNQADRLILNGLHKLATKHRAAIRQRTPVDQWKEIKQTTCGAWRQWYRQQQQITTKAKGSQ